jgi:hypothetical protein
MMSGRRKRWSNRVDEAREQIVAAINSLQKARAVVDGALETAAEHSANRLTEQAEACLEAVVSLLGDAGREMFAKPEAETPPPGGTRE